LKALNLYGGIGGNRKLWPKEVKVTTVELNRTLAAVYKDRYPQDTIVVADAHQYLLEHHEEFDFIWTSPPCQTHSSFRQNIGVRYRGVKAVYPDMKLYQEILFLRYNRKKPWVAENVVPYYPPLLLATALLQRHLFWASGPIPDKEFQKDVIRRAQIPQLQELHGIDLSKYDIPDRRQVLRNCVLPELGLHVLRSLT